MRLICCGLSILSKLSSVDQKLFVCKDAALAKSTNEHTRNEIRKKIKYKNRILFSTTENSNKYTNCLWVFAVWVLASVEIFEVSMSASLDHSYPETPLPV